MAGKIGFTYQISISQARSKSDLLNNFKNLQHNSNSET